MQSQNCRKLYKTLEYYNYMASESKAILQKLDTIKSDLDYLREHLLDVDVVLTDDDIEALKEAEKDLKLGKTKRL